MNKYILIFLIAFSGLSLFGQEDAQPQPPVTIKSASSKAMKYYEKGEEYFRENDFNKAIDAYSKALAEEPRFIDAYLKVASVYYEQKNFQDAEKNFEKVIQLDPSYRPKALYITGLIEYEAGKFGEAAEHFEQFLTTDPSWDLLVQKAENYLADSRFAAQAMANPVPFDPQPLGEGVNSGTHEYLPVLTADGETLIFTRVVRGQEDFYMSRKDSSEWTLAVPIQEINTRENEGAQSISADGRVMVFTACNRPDGYGSCDLYITEVADNRWTKPANMGPAINTRAWESQPALAADGKVLYFAAKRKEGKGLRDIWVSYRNEDGSWQKAEPLPGPVNTEAEEQSPFIHPDNQSLYFMSNGHPGMGNYDLFLSRRGEDGIFGTPVNLGYPINTKSHEGALFISLDGRTAFYATDRQRENDRPNWDQRTNVDIFSFELPEAVRPRPVTYVKARVFDAHTRRPLKATAEIARLSTGQLHASSQTDAAGSFLLCLPAGTSYALSVSKKGYLFHSENFTLTDSFSLKKPFLLDIYLQPIPDEPGMEVAKYKPIVLKNVFFETGSAELLPESVTELNRLKALLEENPKLNIQINGHTDDVGSDEDNQILSENRAKAVYEYLVDNGITASRLSYEGFGESRPVDTNETPEGRQKNRRTEFVIK